MGRRNPGADLALVGLQENVVPSGGGLLAPLKGSSVHVVGTWDGGCTMTHSPGPSGANPGKLLAWGPPKESPVLRMRLLNYNVFPSVGLMSVKSF